MELTHSSLATSVRAETSQGQLGLVDRVLGLVNFPSLANTLNVPSLYRISANIHRKSCPDPRFQIWFQTRHKQVLGLSSATELYSPNCLRRLPLKPRLAFSCLGLRLSQEDVSTLGQPGF